MPPAPNTGALRFCALRCTFLPNLSWREPRRPCMRTWRVLFSLLLQYCQQYTAMSEPVLLLGFKGCLPVNQVAPNLQRSFPLGLPYQG